MIKLTKLNDKAFILNCDLIENIQENPDTTIRLTNGNVFIVKEPMDEVLRLVIAFKKEIFSKLLFGKGDYSVPEEPEHNAPEW
ncbi:MAG: flagellar FlbD family protein [Oscillospiraceae bacterium]